MNSPGVPPGTRTMTSSCASLCLLLVSACNLNNPGVDPPSGVLSYPAAMSFRDPSAETHEVLYVANSNFDLAYNAGSIQVYDLKKLDRAITKHACRSASGDSAFQQLPDGGLDGGLEDGGLEGGGLDDGGADASVGDAGGPLSEDVPLPPGYEDGTEDRGLVGTLCEPNDNERDPCCLKSDDFLLGGKGKSEVLIDSFASALAVAPDGRRLYVPVRSRERLLYLDIDANGQISCGDDDGRCRRGTSPGDEDKDPVAKLEPQATALAVGALDTMVDGNSKGTFLATSHENGAVGFFVDSGDGPVLHSTSFASDTRLTSITADPRQRTLYVTTAFPRSARISRFGLREQGERYALVAAPALTIDDVAGSSDTRDVLLDDEDPNRIFVLMRGVARSLLFLRLDPSELSGVKLEGEVRVDNGPSRLAQATVDGRRVLFVSCFDARTIYVIDVENRRVLRVIRGFAGPFEMLADEARGFLYVADFSVSAVRVVDLRGLFDVRQPPPRIIATLGKVRAPEGLQ